MQFDKEGRCLIYDGLAEILKFGMGMGFQYLMLSSYVGTYHYYPAA